MEASHPDRDLLEAALDATGIGVFDYDARTGRQRLSPQARAIWGLGPDAPADASVIAALVHPDDRHVLDVALGSLDPGGAGGFEVEHRIVRPDGQVRWVRVHARTDFEGPPGARAPVRSVGTMVDVTERRALEQRHAEVLESVTDGFLAIDAAWRIAYLNAAAERIIGEPRDRLVGRDFWEVFPATVGSPLEEGYRHAAAGEVRVFDSRYAPWDRWFHNRCYPRPEGGLVVYFQDITAQKLDEDRAARSAATFEQLVAGNPFGVYVVDADFRLRVVSRGAHRVFERVRPLLGRDFAEVLRAIWPEPFATEALARFRHTLATGEPFVSPGTVERRVDIDAVEAYDWRIERVTMPDGRHGVVCYFYDLSERQAWERRLRTSEAQLEFALARVAVAMDVAQLGIFEWEPRSGALWWDARLRAWWGVPAGAPVTYELFLAGLHPEDRAPVEAAIASALDPHGSGRYFAEYRVQAPGAPLRWVRATGLAHFHEGAAVRLTGAALDVTAQKAHEAALHDADRRKDQFLATLSHELRNPLAPIRTAAELLGLPGLPVERLHWAQGVIRRQVAHMARLLDDLLDVARITQGKVVLRREPVSLGLVVESAIETARPAIEARRHQLLVALPAERVVLDADPHRLAQVLANLLSNAAKYTAPGGRIEVDAALDAAGLRLAVRDTGIGVPAEALPHIFEMFSQVEGSERLSEGGLGIGLALVRGLVQLHGGTVEAASAGAGRGSEFAVRLPRAAIHGASSAAAPAERRGAGGGAARVLVVDDNRDAADSLGMLLQLAGHEVRVAYGGHDALEEAEAFRPQVMLLDLGMPGCSGYDVANAVRRAAWERAPCLVAVTGRGQEVDRATARAAGFDQHLTKPVDPRLVLDVVARSSAGACEERRRA